MENKAMTIADTLIVIMAALTIGLGAYAVIMVLRLL